jgi:hypothetical protein
MDAGLAQVQGWSDELEALCERIAPRLGRVEVHRRAGVFLRGLPAGVERKNGSSVVRTTAAGWTAPRARGRHPMADKHKGWLLDPGVQPTCTSMASTVGPGRSPSAP